MSRKTLLLLLLLVMTLSISAQAQKRRTVGINDDECPVVIERVEAGYSRPFFANGDWQSPFLDVWWKNRNNTPGTIRAAKFKVVIFNVMREHYRTEEVLTSYENLVPGKSNKDAWRWPSWVEEPEAFHFYVVVEKLLFDDGTIWFRQNDAIFEIVDKEMAPEVPIHTLIEAQERERESKQ